MAPVTIDAASRNAYFSSGNIGWSARSLFAYRTAIQQIAGSSSVFLGDTTANTAQGQSFTPASATTLTEVRVVIRKIASPVDDVSLTIESDSSNKPSGSILGTATNVYNGANISGTASWLSFQFATPVSLSASTKYWIVLRRSGAIDAVNYYSISRNTSSGYAGGGTSVYGGATWGAESALVDLAFQVIQQAPIALYAVTQDANLHVWKSTDTGATWTEQDSANVPAVSSSVFPFDATDTIAGPYLATAYLTATNTAAVKLFDMSADAWTSGTFGTTPPTTVSNERNIRVSVQNNYVASQPGAVTLHYSDSADDADLAYQRVTATASAWGAKTSVLALTSTEASLVSDAVTDKTAIGFTHPFYYDCTNDDYSMRSLTTATLGTETDLDATAATTETSHAVATYQVYQASGVDTIIAAYINSDDTIHERILTLEATSASVTMATENTVNAVTTTAGRQLSTARYNGTNYIAVNVSGSGISYYTSTVAGTWSAATSFVSGLTNCTLSRILSIEGVGLAVIYTDNGDTKVDWIAVAGGGSSTVTKTATPVTIALSTPDKTRTATPVTMALQTTPTRTATPVTASLATVNTRTATPITAALQVTLTRSATPTVALWATLTRSATPTIALSGGAAVRSATPITIALSAVLTRSAPVSIALSVINNTRTATPITAALLATKTRSAAASIAVQTTATRSAAATISLSGTGNTRTATPITAALMATRTRSATPAIALQATATRSAPATISLSVAKTRTASPVTIALGVSSTRSAPATAALSSSSTRAATPITAALLATSTRTAPATVAVLATSTRSAPATIALAVIEGLHGHLTFTLTHQRALTVRATTQAAIATTLEDAPALVVQETSERTLASTLTTAPALAFGLEIDE